MPNSARNGYDNGHISAGDKLKDDARVSGSIVLDVCQLATLPCHWCADSHHAGQEEQKRDCDG